MSWLPLAKTRHRYEQYWSIVSHHVPGRASNPSLAGNPFETHGDFPVHETWPRASDPLCFQQIDKGLIPFPSWLPFARELPYYFHQKTSSICWSQLPSAYLSDQRESSRNEKGKPLWPDLLMCFNPCCRIFTLSQELRSWERHKFNVTGSLQQLQCFYCTKVRWVPGETNIVFPGLYFYATASQSDQQGGENPSVHLMYIEHF